MSSGDRVARGETEREFAGGDGQRKQHEARQQAARLLDRAPHGQDAGADDVEDHHAAERSAAVGFQRRHDRAGRCHHQHRDDEDHAAAPVQPLAFDGIQRDGAGADRKQAGRYVDGHQHHVFLPARAWWCVRGESCGRSGGFEGASRRTTPRLAPMAPGADGWRDDLPNEMLRRCGSATTAQRMRADSSRERRR